MKNHSLLMLLALSTFSLNSFAQICDKKKILSLMAQKKIIDVSDPNPSVCLDLQDFPSIRVKMKDQNYGLDNNRLTTAPSKQDESVKKIVGILNSSNVLENGQKFKVITKGVADGTYNGAPNPESANYEQDLQEENEFLASLVDGKGVIIPSRVKSVIGAYDEAGAKEISDALTKYYAENGQVPFSKIQESNKASTRLKSMVRNSVRAKSRGSFLCTKIFGDPSACQAQGEISPKLDTGEHGYKGCCDGRRGAIIDIVPPNVASRAKSNDGNYQPNFRRTTTALQSKLNIAASMSVFQLNLPANAELEKKVLKDLNFGPEVIAEDKQRFSEALKGTGCEKNQFAIDAVRRIYWQSKVQENSASPELVEAIHKGNFSVVQKYFETKKTQADKDLLTTLSTGGNYSTTPVSRASPIPMNFHSDATRSEGGMPTDALNCLDSSKALEHEMASNEGQEAHRAGVPFCQDKPKNMNLDVHSVKDHICSMCKSGPGFDASGNISYSPRHGNKNMSGTADQKGRQRPLAADTFHKANTFDNPLSMASMKHYRSYVIPNCGTSCADSCACLKQPGLVQRIKSAEVVDFSMIPGTKKKQSLKYNGQDEEKTGSFACIYTPPVPDTCSVNPMGNGRRDGDSNASDKVSCPLEASLMAMKPVGGDARFSPSDLDNYMSKCQQLSFPDSQATCEKTIEQHNGGMQCFMAKSKLPEFKSKKSTKKSTKKSGPSGSRARRE